MAVDICTTCLFKDNDLVTLDEELLHILSSLLQTNSSEFLDFLNVETRICYPCQERLQEMGHFRDTVLNALGTLRRELNDEEQLNESQQIKILKVESKFVQENENEFILLTSVPETEFTSIDSLSTSDVNISENTDSSLSNLVKFMNKSFMTFKTDKMEVPEPVTEMSIKFVADDNKETNLFKTNIVQDVKDDLDAKKPRNKVTKLKKAELVSPEQPVVKLLPALAPKKFSPPFKSTTESDHDYTERVESPSITIVKTVSQESEIQEDMNQQEADHQWYIKVLTNEEILARMVAKRRKPEFSAAQHKCTSCVIVFKNAKEGILHDKQCHATTIGRFKCFICTRRFHTVVQLNRHVSLHCSNVYVCAHCSFDTYDRRVIQAHVCPNARIKPAARKRRPKKIKIQCKKVLQCKFCSKTFKSRAGFTLHTDLRHKNLPKEQCQICQKIYKNYYCLQSHMRQEHRNRPKYHCQDCDHTFYSGAGLKLHLQTSLKHVSKDDFKFMCDQCNRRFFFKRDLAEHIKIAHLTERPFKCGVCDKRFATRRVFKRHVTLSHGEKRKIYKCEVCSESFARKLTLEAHTRGHTGDRPFQCQACPSTFSFLSALRNHKQRRHGAGKVTTGSSSQGIGEVKCPDPPSPEKSGCNVKYYVTL